MFLAVNPPADLSPADRLLRAGLVGARRKGGNPHAQRDRLRVAQRLAGGLTPAQAARLEGCAEPAVAALLEQEGFRALVDAHAELEALTPEQRTARLVRLARLALENALMADWDVGAACFVLDEHRHGRDPAVTIAQGAAAQAARRVASPVPRPRPPRRRPPRP